MTARVPLTKGEQRAFAALMMLRARWDRWPSLVEYAVDLGRSGTRAAQYVDGFVAKGWLRKSSYRATRALEVV